MQLRALAFELVDSQDCATWPRKRQTALIEVLDADESVLIPRVSSQRVNQLRGSNL